MMGLSSYGKWMGRMAVLVFLSTLMGLLFNGLRPSGIPLVGQWDTSKVVVSPSASDEEISKTIQSVEEARIVWEAGALFLDARVMDSFDEGHIQGARAFSVYDFDALLFDFLDAVPETNTPLVVYCSGRLCDESHRLAGLLEEVGYTNVRVFADGYPAWKAAGLPVSSGGLSEKEE